MPGGFPKSDLLGVTVALIHVAAQRFLAVKHRPTMFHTATVVPKRSGPIIL